MPTYPLLAPPPLSSGSPSAHPPSIVTSLVPPMFNAQAEESPKNLILKKVMNELDRINNGMNKSITLNSPTINDLEDCCVKSALNCFQSKVLYLSVPDGKLKKLQIIISNELHKIVNRVSDCKPKELEKAQCKPCDSYKEVDSQTFVQNLKTLLQKIYASQP
ncbi:interleukin-21-like [Carassius carassius]|uniref:interleukin-21-like n=1 Tax=Carassius carassius TaxID=217509 RepID=UPI0028695ED7|nr:interleukin-21-like [Carassius carassius]